MSAALTVGCWGAVGGLVLFGFRDDIRLWVEERRWRQDQVWAAKRLSLYPDAVAPAPAPSLIACERAWAAESEAEVMERMRSGVALAEALAAQIEEIRGLPEVRRTR